LQVSLTGTDQEHIVAAMVATAAKPEKLYKAYRFRVKD
jgi:hypothetical protein